MVSKGASPPVKGGPHIVNITKNRRALFDYFVESKIECGIELYGTEVKSLRSGHAQLSDSYAVGQRGELVLMNASIEPYGPAGQISNHASKRTRKLLLHRREIDKLLDAQQRDGYALVPLSLYFKDGRAKLELGLCKGKQNVDKRETIAKRDATREMARERKK
jgi:SsrA-binding protein